MGLDLNDVNQNVLKLIENASNRDEFLVEYTSSTAKDVTIHYADGSSKTYPNLTKQISVLNDWKDGFENKMYRTYDIFKEFDKVRIHTQAQVDADDTLSNEATFTIQGFADAKVISFMLVVNVEGDSDSSHNGNIDIRRYSIGSASGHKYDQILVENASIQGKDWEDNYRDVNIIPVNQNIGFGIGTFKITNVGTQYIEIFAIGVKLQK